MSRRPIVNIRIFVVPLYFDSIVILVHRPTRARVKMYSRTASEMYSRSALEVYSRSAFPLVITARPRGAKMPVNLEYVNRPYPLRFDLV